MKRKYTKDLEPLIGGMFALDRSFRGCGKITTSPAGSLFMLVGFLPRYNDWEDVIQFLEPNGNMFYWSCAPNLPYCGLFMYFYPANSVGANGFAPTDLQQLLRQKIV